MLQHKFTLEEHRLPTHYYNVVADMAGKHFHLCIRNSIEPLAPKMSDPLFPQALIAFGDDRRAFGRDPRGGPRQIPQVQAHATFPRPRPRLWTRRRAFTTSTRRESSGSHKPNTALAKPITTRKLKAPKIVWKPGRPMGLSVVFPCAQTAWNVRYAWSSFPTTKSRTARPSRTPTAPPFTPPRRASHRPAEHQAADPNSPGSLATRHQWEAVEVAQDPDAVRPRLRAQPCAAAPNRGRSRGHEANGKGRRNTDVVIAPFGGAQLRRAFLPLLGQEPD